MIPINGHFLSFDVETRQLVAFLQSFSYYKI